MENVQTLAQWLKWSFKANGPLRIKDHYGREVYSENEFNVWTKTEYLPGDNSNNYIYKEKSTGEIYDNRHPETLEYNGRKYLLIP
jgi:hypothetical protein